MKPEIDLKEKHYSQVLDIIKRYLPDTTVWVYGSRAKHTATPRSDLDMVVFSSSEDKLKVADLREAFEESNLPFRVDLFVWDEVPDKFKENIEAEHKEILSSDKA